jgi:hypothetical protein
MCGKRGQWGDAFARLKNRTGLSTFVPFCGTRVWGEVMGTQEAGSSLLVHCPDITEVLGTHTVVGTHTNISLNAAKFCVVNAKPEAKCLIPQGYLLACHVLRWVHTSSQMFRGRCYGFLSLLDTCRVEHFGTIVYISGGL